MVPLPTADAGSSLRVAISGASGLVGTALTARLTAAGHQVTALVRPGSGRPGIVWDPQAGTIDAAGLRACDAVIHLAGETVAQRWTTAARERILASRVAGTGLLARTLAEDPGRVRVFVSASGVARAGGTGDRPATEADDLGTGFLAEVVRAWEGAAAPLAATSMRTVFLRTGVVLSPAGGALAQMLLPFRCGLGGPVGHGRQWLPWIGLDDLTGLYLQSLTDPRLVGPVHAVTGSIRQGEFARILGKVLGRPAFLPLPALAVKLLMGAMGRELLLESLCVQPAAAFTPQDPALEPFLTRILA